MYGARLGDTRFPLKGTPPSVMCPCRCAAPFGSRGPIKPRASYAAGRARRSWSVYQNSLSPCGRVPWDLAVCAVGGWVLSNPGFHRDSPPLVLGSLAGCQGRPPAVHACVVIYAARGSTGAALGFAVLGANFRLYLGFCTQHLPAPFRAFWTSVLSGTSQPGSRDLQGIQAIQYSRQ